MELLYRGDRRKLRPAEDMPPEGTREVFVFPHRNAFLGSRSERFEKDSRELSGMLKIVEQRVAATGDAEPPRVMGVRYTQDTSAPQMLDRMADYYHRPDRHSSADAQQFVDTVLLPRLMRGQKHPFATVIQHRMSALTFVSHSFGAVFAQEVANALRDRLAEHGYAERDIGRICRSAVLISTSGPNVVHTVAPHFIALNFRNPADQELDTTMKLVAPLLPLKGLSVDQIKSAIEWPFEKRDSRCHPVPDGMLVYAPIAKGLRYQDGDRERVIGKGNEGEKQNISHSPAPFWHPALSEVPQSQMLANRLINQSLANALSPRQRGQGEVNAKRLMLEGRLLSAEERSMVDKVFATQGQYRQ